MNPIVKNILAVIIGIIVGMIVNMGLIMIGGALFPIPDGVDPMNAHEWELKQFVFPFLAHALGTLAGAIATVKMAASHQNKLAIGIGFWFLAGGVAMVFMIPAPEWFIFTDLALAYIPMGIIAGKLFQANN
jgi:hypothetical protein